MNAQIIETNSIEAGSIETGRDAELLSREERIEALMQRRLGNRIRALRIRIEPQGIVIQGRSATYHGKQLAQHAAMELAELPILANDIEVC
jgi:hypothetical protein